MPYVREVCRAGKVVEVEEYYTPRYKKRGIKRSPNHKPSTEKQEAINERRAARDLRRLIATNFDENSYFLTLTYRREEAAPSIEDGKAELKKFLRNARGYCKRRGETFKYIYSTEWENKRIHHHIIIDIGNADIREFVKLWKHGRPKVQVLDESGNYTQLADYLIKETRKSFRNPDSPNKKRYSCSRNLKKPDITKTIVKADSWRKTPRIWKGYTLEDLYTGYSDYTGYPFRRYIMIKRC